ncbi:hypothetical protein ES705_41343 [subsurface metagenome]
MEHIIIGGQKDWGRNSLKEVLKKKKISLIPLLHRSIAGGRFIQSHEYFCNHKGANYFEFVGKKLADIMLEFNDIYIK